MKAFFIRWITIMVTTVITLSVFESLLPGEDIKKSCLFIGRLVFLLSVFLPIVGLIKNGADADVWPSYYRHSFRMEKGLYESSGMEDDTQKQLIENLFYKHTVDTIENYANRLPGVASSKADVILEKGDDPSACGKIKKITVHVVLDKTKTQRPTERQLAVKIAEYFQVDEEYVYVSVLETNPVG